MDCHACDARHLRSNASLHIKLLKTLPSTSAAAGLNLRTVCTLSVIAALARLEIVTHAVLELP